MINVDTFGSVIQYFYKYSLKTFFDVKIISFVFIDIFIVQNEFE